MKTVFYQVNSVYIKRIFQLLDTQIVFVDASDPLLIPHRPGSHPDPVHLAVVSHVCACACAAQFTRHLAKPMAQLSQAKIISSFLFTFSLSKGVNFPTMQSPKGIYKFSKLKSSLNVPIFFSHGIKTKTNTSQIKNYCDEKIYFIKFFK